MPRNYKPQFPAAEVRRLCAPFTDYHLAKELQMTHGTIGKYRLKGAPSLFFWAMQGLLHFKETGQLYGGYEAAPDGED